MKRSLFSLVMIAVMYFNAYGDPVDETTAKQLAQNFWKENNIMGVKGNKVFKKKMGDARFVNVAPQCGYTEFYIFNNENGKGFVIIAADDCVTPILGYSYENNFAAENLPPNLKNWLDSYAEQIQNAVEMRVTATDEVRADWECLRQAKNLPIRSENAVDHLLSTTWGQDEYYNMLCPEDSYGIASHAPTGCVATAMAQILKFWEYPNDAHRVVWHEYEHPVYGTLGANYSYAGGSYYWNYMPNQLTYSSSTYQKQAVASLMYHCGVSVEMDYGPIESGAKPMAAEIAFRSFFDYNNATLVAKSAYTDTQWVNLLKNELDNGRPVFYAGTGLDGGHAFVCDGYNNSNYFWFNWGWSGTANGFFSVNSLTPTVNGHQFDFTYNQQAIIGVEPGGNNNYHLLGMNDNIKLNGYSGNMFWFDTQIQEITTEIFNWGNTSFNGSVYAVVLDGEVQYMAESEVINNCQISPMQSSGQLSFTFSEPLNILTCKAYVVIYSIENNEAIPIYAYGMHPNPKEYYNYYTLSEDMVELYLYSNIEYSPASIVQNSAITVTANITNEDNDNVTFNGYYAAALYGLNGELKQILATIHEVNGLQPNYHYTNPLNFSCPSVTVPAGTYYLTIIQKQEGSDNWYPLLNWEDCVNPVHVNPIRVNVVSPVDTFTITATSNPSNGGTVSYDYDFEDGLPVGWNVIDANNDGYTWCMTKDIPSTWSYYASETLDWYRSGTNAICSGSYINGVGALAPDEYLVTNQLSLVNGSRFSFWAAATDANYPSDHFGVFVSDNGTSNWTSVQEWTLTAKGGEFNGSHASREGNGAKLGTWHQYSVDLSAYAGQQKYVAIRHFNCTDQYIMCVDDIAITSGGGGTYNQGQSCSVHATSNTGFAFVNWTENGTQASSDTNYTFTVNGNRNLVANFQAQTQQYTISVTASPSNGGNVTGGGTFNQGQSCIVHATANSGYTFVNWTENGTQVTTSANYAFTVTGNRNLIAHFTTQNYVITAVADPTSGGAVTGSGGYNYGETCTLTATANDGYTFQSWTKNGTQVSTNPTYSFSVTESATYTAHFNAQSYTITVEANPNTAGSVSGGGSYTYGQTCTVSASANSSYAFTNWTENGTQVSSNANYNFTVTGNRNLVANFAQNTHAIQASAGANGIITPSGTITVAHGASQSFAMIPDSDYEVQEVYIDGNPIGAMTSYTFTNVTADHYIHVVFTSTVGVDETTNDNALLYPNPTSSIVTIRGEEIEEIHIFNALGVMVKDMVVDGKESVIVDLSDLPCGVFILQLTFGNQVTTKRVIKLN